MIVCFTVPGPPQGKARARTYHNASGVHTVTPEKTVMYENLVKMCYASTKRVPFGAGVPLSATITAYYAMPKSMSKADRVKATHFGLFPTKKPDADNIAKVVLDALNGIAYDDDRQIVNLEVTKLYAEEPKVTVAILDWRMTTRMYTDWVSQSEVEP